jgi:predicted DNA-binding transcriptional regulator AlpA
MKDSKDPLLVSIREAKRLLSLGESRIYSLMESGDLKRVKIGKRALISYKSVVELAERGTASLMEKNAKKCAKCGASFKPTGPQIYCSVSCRPRRKQILYRPKVSHFWP